MTQIPNRFPKVESPYRRAENTWGDYVVDPDGSFLGTKQKFEWVFDRAEEVEAIEKLDGTNVAVAIDQFGDVVDVATRMGDKSMNEIDVYGTTNHHYIVRGVQNSVRRGYIEYCSELGDGWFFGELIGPKMQGNPHDVDEHLFVPFDWMRDKLEYKSYGKYDTSPDAIHDWFAGDENGLFSLFASRIHGQDLEASRPINGTFVEGLILITPNYDGRIHPEHLTLGNGGQSVKELAKIRRDMYQNFQNDVWPMTEYGH
jgi:hypothetical protein